MTKSSLSFLLARYGFGFVFLVFGFQKLISPDSWAGYVPQYIVPVLKMIGISMNQFLFAHGILEVLIALCVITGSLLRPAVLVASVFLLLIVVQNWFNELAIRDIALLAMGLALVFWHGQGQSVDATALKKFEHKLGLK